MVYQYIPEPSTEYEDKSLGTWSTTAQVNTFFTEHTYANGWSGLKIGNYVTINDGTYNVDWVIAGFNYESSTDGTPGGIIFIPRYTNLTTNAWYSSDSSATPYMYSDIHSYINGIVKTNLSTILGSHIVQRYVALGSACSGTSPRSWTTSATTSTTAYLTLMSVGQITGTFASHNNSYDDGEANYKLPLMNFISLSTYANAKPFWFRNVYGMSTFIGEDYFCANTISTRGDAIDAGRVSADAVWGTRPLMYLR